MSGDKNERNGKIHSELWGSVVLEGQLEKWPVNKIHKHGKESRWKTRYFVLADNLCYYEAEDDFKGKKRPKGVLCLDFAAVAMHSSDKCKITVRTPDKMLVLKLKSEGEAETWLKALKLAQTVKY